MIVECISSFKNWLFNPTFDDLVDGKNAHEYTDPEIRNRIAQEYKDRYCAPTTPLTNPELYDPLNPPQGYAYDPYYEIWIET